MSIQWDPAQYLKFRSQRTQPSIDLARRIDLEDPRSVLDVGCGPGNSTQVLRERWPTARVLGMDNSPDMIEEARRTFPEGEWIKGDAALLPADTSYDVVFSNAVLQWVPDHRTLVPRLFSAVSNGGVLAVQLPANSDSPLYHALIGTSSGARWRDATRSARDSVIYHSPDFYYEILSKLSTSIDLWVTIYYHEMPDHQSLVEWYKGTGMKPYLEALPDDTARATFEAEILGLCRERYPVQSNGRVLYPFRRLFFIARRQD